MAKVRVNYKVGSFLRRSVEWPKLELITKWEVFFRRNVEWPKLELITKWEVF